MIPARILGSAHLFPGRLVTTAEVVERSKPGKDPARLEAATGIRTRHWKDAPDGTTTLGLAVLRDALANAGLEAGALRRVIFVSSLCGDLIVPSNATALIGALGLDGRCDGFDLQNACVGFVSALDVAARGVATGVGVTAIVVVELGSRQIQPERPRPYGIFGDAAAAVILGPARGAEGFRAIALSNTWASGPTAILENPALTGHAYIDFTVTADTMVEMAVRGMVGAVRDVLTRAELTLDDVRWVLPHQPNLPLLMAFAKALAVDPSRLDVIVRDAGSLAAAVLPVTLDRLLRAGTVRSGDRILFATVGSPLVTGAALYECP